MTRREFLSRVLPAIAIGLAAVVLWRPGRVVRALRLAGIGDAALVAQAYFAGRDLAAIGALGRTYLDGFESATAALADLRMIDAHGDVDDAVARLRSSVTDDFDNSRLAAVGGWQLSVTEARLCGIASLL